MKEILISRSLDFSDYEILIRQRGNYEYTAYSPQLNYMVKSDDILKAKEMLFKKINSHINFNMNNPDLVDEYNQKIEDYREEKSIFISQNLKKNNDEEIIDLEENQENFEENTEIDINENDFGNEINDDNFNELNIDDLENIDSI